MSDNAIGASLAHDPKSHAVVYVVTTVAVPMSSILHDHLSCLPTIFCHCSLSVCLFICCYHDVEWLFISLSCS